MRDDSQKLPRHLTPRFDRLRLRVLHLGCPLGAFPKRAQSSVELDDLDIFSVSHLEPPA